MKPQITKPVNLASFGAELNQNLKSIQPANSEITQIITYTLLATALVGITVYHYIRKQESCYPSKIISPTSKEL
jgi:hypothetical protein